MKRHALVTGAGTGIGRAIAIALAERGLTVHAVGRRQPPLEGLRQSAADLPGEVVVHVADAGVPGNLEDLLSGVEGRLEVAVASAGFFERGAVAELSPASWDAQVHGNLTTAFHTLKAVTTRMQSQEKIDGCAGHVFTLNSGAGVQGFPTGSAYAASKHGLRGLVESLRQELTGTGVKLTDLVVSATVESEMSAGRDVPMISPDAVAHTVTACLDLGGIATWDRVDISQLR
ncbi:SDR family oxidoreductase [Nocardioides gilvus]|uniref:SDR family oxidoreductase n=1 Tax=Nocardioides gilvus TaxID=1735589 RepID=UPI0013A55FFD|nr:SDR family oxidoreductase [Nocardioides gilvus]